MIQYNIAGGGLTGIQGISPITINDVTGNKKKFSNYKVTVNIYGAHGGHIVEVTRGGYGADPELHIISDEEEFDRSLGKIITHYQLKQE